MRINKLKLKNIRSYEDQEILFPSGSLLLAGDVGSGKTSLLLAIEYALFGLQPGQVGSALLRNNAQYGEVSLVLEIDEQEIVIERKLKRGKSITNDYAALIVNGDRIECSITELKTKILDILNYPIEFLKKNNLLYKYTVYTPQEQMKQIVLEDSESRLNILRHIFGIDKYKTIRENLVILLAKIKEDSKLIQGEIRSLEEEKKRLESASFLTLEIDKKIKEQNKIIEELVKKRKEIESEAKDIDNKIKEKDKYENEFEKAKFLYQSKKESLRDIMKEISDIEIGVSEKNDAFDKSEFEDILSKIEMKKDYCEKLQSDFIDLSSRLNSLNQRKKEDSEKKDRIFSIDICPTCLQDVPQAHKHNILNDAEKSISDLSKEIALIEQKRKEIEVLVKKEKIALSELEKNKTRLEILESKIPEVEKSLIKMRELRKNQEMTEKDINLIEKLIYNLRENISEFSKFNSQFKAKQEELKKAFISEKNAEIFLAELKKELEITNKDINVLREAIGKKEIQKARLSEIFELQDWLSNQFLNLIDFTEKNVMLKLRLEFSKVFGKWFNILVQDSFEVQLDEKFTPVIIQGGVEMDYSFLSGGERTAVALAYRLALNQTINSMLSNIKTKDIVILDEPTEGFSDVQIEKIREVLQELKVKQLIMVSHEQKIESFVDHIIKIKKNNNASYLETIA